MNSQSSSVRSVDSALIASQPSHTATARSDPYSQLESRQPSGICPLPRRLLTARRQKLQPLASKPPKAVAGEFRSPHPSVPGREPIVTSHVYPVVTFLAGGGSVLVRQSANDVVGPVTIKKDRLHHAGKEEIVYELGNRASERGRRQTILRAGLHWFERGRTDYARPSASARSIDPSRSGGR